ncbi:MAG: hypothetical protein IJ443_07040 [Firmicutes bacterium]|nr:hypothetical protein [Bacillota bacterium]
MKKILSIILCMALVLSTASIAMASTGGAESKVIKLEISSSPEDLEFIKRYAPSENVSLEAIDNQIVMQFEKTSEYEEGVCISGKGSATMFGTSYDFAFKDKGLDRQSAGGQIMFSDSFDVEIDDEYDGIVDITATEDFSQAIISFTLINLTTEEQHILLYGDVFTEQTELFQQQLKEVEVQAAKASLTQDISPAASEVMATSGGAAYQHVSNKSNSTLAGEAQDKQMMVMNISKCDPKNIGSGATQGYELIRVFSRSYNLSKVDPTVLMAEPKFMDVRFTGDSDALFMVNGTKPNEESGALESVFKIFTSVIGSVTSGPIATVAAVISSLPLGIGDTITVSGTNATFYVSVDDYDASDIDLPAATASSDAETDESHGVVFKVLYTRDLGYDQADITVSSSISYRAYLNSDRTSTMKTGTATYSHAVNLI